jgi:hypothetical protein
MSNDDYIGVSSCMKNHVESILWARHCRGLGNKAAAAWWLKRAAIWRKEVALWKSYSGAV